MVDALGTPGEDRFELPAPPERAGGSADTAASISHRISAAGLQVSQAAEELRQAARALIEADRHAREAEARWSAADAQLEQAAEKNAELLEALEQAKRGQAEADERARRAEQRLQATIEHQAEMERQLAEIEERWREAEAQPRVVIVDDERDELQQTLGAEIRRPLTSILGLTLALKHSDPKSPEAKNMVKQLTTNARRLDRLVGQMLDLDKIATGALTPNRRRTDVEALVRRVVEESPDLANRDLRVETEHVAINVDPALTEQMVETLLSNAGRRSAPGGPVWVRVSSDPEGVVIAVDDSGPEFPEGMWPKRPAASSTGGPAARRKASRGATGLFLLSRLAEIHGGRAWVEERPGGGASFRVFLPNQFQQPPEEDADERAVDLSTEQEEGEVLFDTAVAAGAMRELSSFDDLTGEIAI